MKQEIILASASKRRSQILASCGIKHKVYITGADEIHKQSRSARWNVSQNAKIKAFACAEKCKNSVIIGADTLVVLDRELIGKPGNRKEAKSLLKKFSGKKLYVVTGLCVINQLTDKNASGSESSTLYTEKLNSHDISSWFNALRPYDKAGGFSIEGVGSLIYDNIKGSYFNILGLPMIKLKRLFKKTGLNILDFCGGMPETATL